MKARHKLPPRPKIEGRGIQTEKLLFDAAESGWPIYDFMDEHLADCGGIEPLEMASFCPRVGRLTGAYRDYLASVVRFTRAQLRRKKKRMKFYSKQIDERVWAIRNYNRTVL